MDLGTYDQQSSQDSHWSHLKLGCFCFGCCYHYRHLLNHCKVTCGIIIMLVGFHHVDRCYQFYKNRSGYQSSQHWLDLAEIAYSPEADGVVPARICMVRPLDLQPIIQPLSL